MSEQLLNKTKIFIGKKGSDTRKRLPACYEIPDFSEEPEMVETTTLDDNIHTSVMGVGEAGDLTFGFRKRKGEDSAYAILSEMKKDVGTEYTVDVEFKDGEMISFDTSGVSLSILGGGLNEVRNFEATFPLSSEFRFGDAKGELDTLGFDGDE